MINVYYFILNTKNKVPPDKDIMSSISMSIVREYSSIRWNIDRNLLDVIRPENGKPVFRDYPQCHFNISHSGNHGACVLADTPVGIDIEAIGGLNTRVLDRILHRTGKTVYRQ
jgi:4'-phosphopantetheinyl transferase